jgi:hypothetical protein
MAMFAARALFLVVIGVPTLAAAEARSMRAGPAKVPGARAAADCPAFFGGEQARAINVERRRQLYWIDEEAGGVTIAHRSEQWDEPVPLSFAGLRLGSASQRGATIELSSALAASLGCRAGHYRVAVDDSLGRRTRVLAILDGALLLERRTQLVYMLAPGARSPRWLVAWSAPGTVRASGDAGGLDDNSAPYRRPHFRHHPY